MRIVFLQHDRLDGPGSLGEWAVARGYEVTVCHVAEEALPATGSFDMAVSLGGPMGAYEEDKFPWLAAEKQFLREAAAGGKRLLGLCLGCQLLADAFGGRAFRHTCKEFGWQTIELTPEGLAWPPFDGIGASFPAFQWHGDTYSLPAGAVRLARNAACEQQAFAIGHQILGLQFHLEWTLDMARDALAEPGVAPPPGPSVQTPQQILSDTNVFHSAREKFFLMMDRFVVLEIGGRLVGG